MARLRFEPIRGDAFRGLLAHVAKHLFTSADGETYAIGRVLGTVLFLWGLGAPTGLALWKLIDGPAETMAEWVDFINAMILYLPALVAGVTALIALTSQTEPEVPPQEPKGDTE